MTQLTAVRIRFLSRICPPPSIVWRRHPYCSSRPQRCWGQTLTPPLQERSSLRAPEVSVPSVICHHLCVSVFSTDTSFSKVLEVNALVSVSLFGYFPPLDFPAESVFKYSLILPFFNFLWIKICKAMGHLWLENSLYPSSLYFFATMFVL